MVSKKINKSQIWIVIPAYNEEKYIGRVLKKVGQITSNIVVVDDGSSDSTRVKISRYPVHYLKHKVNLGKGAALKTGCEYVFGRLGGQAVIFLDSDDQHDPEKLPDFFRLLQAGHQAVFGERAMNFEMPLIRIIGNRLASLLILIFFGRYIPDIPSGFKAITKQTYQKIVWESAGYEVETEIAARVARYQIEFEVVTIPTIYHDTDKGMTLLDTFEMITKIISWRLSK